MKTSNPSKGGAGRTKPARALSHRALEALKPEAEPYRIADSRCQGLAVRVAQSGKVTYDLSFRIKGGRARRLSLGSFPQVSLEHARNRANDLVRAARSGKDLIEQEAAAKAEASQRLTVANLIDQYCQRPAARSLKTRVSIERRLRRSLESLAARFAATIRRRDLRELFDAVAEQGMVREAETRRQTVGAMFRWAVNADYLEIDPTSGLLRYDGGQPRDRILNSSEIRAFWKFLDEGHILLPHADVLRLQLLLGARCGEIGGMEREEIDKENWLWTLPASRSKNKRSRVTPILGQARAIIVNHMDSSGPMFFSQRGTPLTSSTVGSIIFKYRARINLSHFTTHDLRRTVASGLDELGVIEDTIAAVIGHETLSRKNVTLRRHYIFTERLARKAAALSLWDSHIDTILKCGN